MTGRGIWRFAAAALAALWAFGAGLRAQPAVPGFANVSVHDPSVLRVGPTFYVFGSHLALASSTDLARWTQLANDQPAATPLAANPQSEFQEALSWVGSGGAYWAPDVIRLADGRYCFYYCVGRLDQPRAALGLAVSDSPTGPYAHRALLLRSGAGGQPAEAGAVYDPTVHPNAVDPAVFFDAAGRLWMVYGSYSGGIFILQLDATTGLPRPGQGYGKRLVGGNHARIEGAYILYSPETAYYYLFLSFGGLGADGGYNIRLARSRAPDGPYLDAAGTDLTTVRGAPGTLFDDASIAPHGVKLMGSYQFLRVAGEPGTQSRGYRSPGHNSAYYDAATGRYWLFFHTRFVGRGEAHEMRVHPMLLNEEGWLVVAPHRFAGEAPGASSAATIVGDYKLINHGKAISSTVNTSNAIRLESDGRITGAAVGTWKLSGERFATLTLGDTAYRGVFARQWDDDGQAWVRTFSALSRDGIAIWGSKVATSTPERDPPGISAGPASQTVDSGGTAVLSVTASGENLSYQWRKDGAALAGMTDATLTLRPLSAADSGTYTVTLANAAGQATSAPAVLRVEAPQRGRLVNLSVRCRAGTGSETLIAGFVVAGGGTKPVLVRGIGATLGHFGLAGTLADPALELFRDGTSLATNDSWRTAPNLPAILAANGHRLGGFELDKDDAVVLRELSAGGHTAHVKGAAGASGVALIEVYDQDSAAPGSAAFDVQPRLLNLSARSAVGSGADVLIAGFVLNGNVPRRMAVRAIGGTLARFGVSGVLADPVLELHGPAGVVAQNDNWLAAPDRAALVRAYGDKLAEFTLEPADAALVVTLVPGAYTAVVRSADGGADGGAGVALVEVTDLEP